MSTHFKWAVFVAVGAILITSRVTLAQFGPGARTVRPADSEEHAGTRNPAATFRLAEKADAQAPRPHKWIGESNSAVVKKIDMVLSSPLHSDGVDYVEQPLNDVVKSLEKEYDIPIMLDAAALDAIAIRPDEPITVNLHGISLKSALRRLLKNVQLTYMISDEVLLITTQDEEEKRVQMCVYDVHDLVDTQNSQSLTAFAKVLSEAINDLPPHSDGNESSIRPVAPGALIVTLSWSKHEMLRELLAALRETARPADVAKPSHDPFGGSPSASSAKAVPTPTPALAE